MTFHWKSCRFLVCAALLALASGCSGINTTRSFSPASLLLPGLLKADPPKPAQPFHPEIKLPDPTKPATPEQDEISQVALAR